MVAVVLTAAVWVSASAGCGGAAAPSQEPASSPPSPAAEVEWSSPETPAGAWTKLDEAEQQLSRALGGARLDSASAAPLAQGPDAPSEAAPSPPEDPSSQALPYPDRCEVVCAAFSSMKRAGERVCELTGSDEPRCVRAGERIERARALVQGACPSCAEAAG